MAANIWIQLSKDIYTCGEPIQGTVNVICTNAVYGQQLVFKIKGKEQTKWVDLVQVFENPQQPLNIPEGDIERVNDVNLSDDSSDSDDDDCIAQKAMNVAKGIFHKRKYPYIRKNNNQLFSVNRGKGHFKITNQVQNFGQLQIGQYQFPFQFNSQKNWPGSFLNELSKERGRIKYTLVAQYGNSKTKTEFFLQEYKPSESDNHSVNAKISSWCCVGQGNVKMDVSFAKDSLFIGEQQTVKIKLDCTNLSVNINSLNVVLNNHLTYRSDDGKSLTRSHPVYHTQLQGCIAKGVKEFTENFIVQFNESKYCIRPTCHGNKITSTYVLLVEAVNDATCACCSDNASVGNDTFIYSKPLVPASQLVVVQPNFVPVVQPVVNVVVQNFVAQSVIPVNNQMPPPTMNNNNQFQQPQSQNQPLMQATITPQQNQAPQYPPQNQQPQYPPQNQQSQYPPQNQQPQYPPQNQQPQYPPQNQQAQYPPQNQQPQYPPQNQNGNQMPQQQAQYPPPNQASVQLQPTQIQVQHQQIQGQQQQQQYGMQQSQPGLNPQQPQQPGLGYQQPNQQAQYPPQQYPPQNNMGQVPQQQQQGYYPQQPGVFVNNH
ncbi:hypothetical protein ABPG74_008080 [Tetrahymena malaccensis]